MASVNTITLGSAAAQADGATTLPVRPSVREPAIPRAASALAVEPRARRAYGMLLLAGAGVLISLPVLALAGALALLALAVSGPYLSLAVLSIAYALLVLIATAVAG